MENPFEYVKSLQSEFDDSKVQYSDDTTMFLELRDSFRLYNPFFVG